MRRDAYPERYDWRATADAAGFTFHTRGGERYWDERAYYGFTLDEIERQIETPTAEIDAMCMELVGRATGDERYLRRLKIPEAFWPLIAESWRRRDASLYGRLDLAFDGRAPAATALRRLDVERHAAKGGGPHPVAPGRHPSGSPPSGSRR